MLDKTVEANTTVSVFVENSNVKEREAMAKLLNQKAGWPAKIDKTFLVSWRKTFFQAAYPKTNRKFSTNDSTKQTDNPALEISVIERSLWKIT